MFGGTKEKILKTLLVAREIDKNFSIRVLPLNKFNFIYDWASLN